MSTHRIRSFWGMTRVIVLAGVGLTLAAAARGQSPPANAPPADPPVLPGAGADGPDLTEQSIYIPYDKLRQVFEEKGRGVFLPYEQFRALWRAAHRRTVAPDPVQAPVDAIVTRAMHEAVVAGDVMRVEAAVTIEVLKSGWQEIPLRLADAAITKATVAGKPARIIRTDAGYALLYHKRGEKPERIELKLEYARSFHKAPGRNTVAFQPPAAPVSRWRVVIDEPGVEVNLAPMLAATKAPATADAKQTVVLAFVGAAPVVRVDWTPRAEGATGLAALATVQARQRMTIDEGVARTAATLEYEISRAELPKLVIDVPADQKVVNVFDPNVRQWSVAEVDGRQRITADLFEPARGKQSLVIELEQFTGEESRATVAAPVIEAIDVARQQGVVVVEVASTLRAEATERQGLLQVDTAELPEPLKQRQWPFAYRYASVPFTLALAVEKVQPEISADVLTQVRVEPRELDLRMHVVYTIERAGVFTLALDVPEDYHILSVSGFSAPSGRSVSIDAWHRGEDDKARVTINLSRKAIGRMGLQARLRRSLDEPDLLTPTGKAVEVGVPLPRVAGEHLQRQTGRLIVFAPEALRVNPVTTEGLRTIPFDQAWPGILPNAPSTSAQARPVLVFACGEQDAALRLEAERRRPQVTVRQLLVGRVEPGVIQFDATFFYDIRYSGVKSVRIDLPSELAERIHNETNDVREQRMDPQPEDVAEDDVAWSFTGKGEMLGSRQVRLSWEQPLEDLQIGRPRTLLVPRLIPRAVDRAWGQVVLTKAETMDVMEASAPRNMRPIDPQHDLMPGAGVRDAARAFEFHGDWRLAIAVTRYQLEEIKRTSIEKALVRMIRTRAGETAVQALYRVRSARQRLDARLPEGVDFDTEPLRVNGRPMALERGEGAEFKIPLTDQSPDQPFLLELRYTLREGTDRLSLPVFPEKPAVQKVYLAAYLPVERDLLGTRGPWTPEMRWTPTLTLRWRSKPEKSEGFLIQWVTQGLPVSRESISTFQTDGKMHLLSTLRPEGEAAARLITINRRLLSVLVFAIVLIGAVVLLPAGARAKWIATGGLIAVLVLIGVLLPTFSRQVIDSVLAAAIFLGAVLWLVWYVAWARPRDPALQAVRQAKREAKLARTRAKPAPAPDQPPAPDQHEQEGGQRHE